MEDRKITEIEAEKIEILAKVIVVFRLSFVVVAKSGNKLSLFQTNTWGINVTSLCPVNLGNWPLDQLVVITFCVWFLKGHSHVSKANSVVVKTVKAKFRFSVSLKYIFTTSERENFL